MDYFINMAFSIIFEALITSIKNPEKKSKLKRAMLKLRNTINATYADDPDFQ